MLVCKGIMCTKTNLKKDEGCQLSPSLIMTTVSHTGSNEVDCKCPLDSDIKRGSGY